MVLSKRSLIWSTRSGSAGLLGVVSIVGVGGGVEGVGHGDEGVGVGGCEGVGCCGGCDIGGVDIVGVGVGVGVVVVLVEIGASEGRSSSTLPGGGIFIE